MTDEQRQRIWEIENSCDGRTELAERIVALEAENAKLRSELESVGTAAYLYGRGDLQAENAKLREELADVSKCETCEAMLDCDECLRADDSQKERKRIAFENAKLREVIDDITEVVEASDPALVQFIAKRMERAGIEVDG